MNLQDEIKEIEKSIEKDREEFRQGFSPNLAYALQEKINAMSVIKKQQEIIEIANREFIEIRRRCIIEPDLDVLRIMVRNISQEALDKIKSISEE